MNISSIMFQQPNRNNPHKGETGYYSSVYFRIEKNGYTGQGWSDNQIVNGKWVSALRQSFSNEVEQLFTAHEWTIIDGESDCISATVVKGKNSLYLHPQSFSGVCENGEIEVVREFLAGNTFILSAVDIYEEICVMSDAELFAKLDNERESIRSEILSVYTTKRRNLFVAGTSPIESIGRRHSVKRLALGNRSDHNGLDQRSDGICQVYAAGIFKELQDIGAIVSANTKNGIGFRTVKQKKTAA